MKFIYSILTITLLSLSAHAATIVVPAGGSLQNAVNSAQLGDTIIIEAGASYSNLFLPVKAGSAYLTIQSSRAAELPVGARVSPAQSALLAKIQSVIAAEPVIKTAPGAHHYRFIGVDLSTSTASLPVYDLVRWGEGRGEQKTLDSVPHHLSIDRSWLHGWDTQDVQRGVSMNSADSEVTNSSITDVHGVGFDTQCIAGWNGTLNARIVNNYLACAGENVMFGGADSASDAFIPSGIEIRANHFFKPMSWKVGDPSYAGKHWTVKNHLELKSAKNVVADGNVLENNWTDGQDGTMVLFTVRNQDCTAPWSTVQKVTFSNNTVRNATGGGINFLGKDNEAEPSYEDRPGHPKCSDPGESYGSVRGSDVLVHNNLFYDIKGAFTLLNGFYNITQTRNTHLQTWNLITLYGEPSQGFKRQDNLTIDHEYGIVGDGAGGGVTGLNKLAPGWVWTGDVIANPYDNGANYPPGNDYPTSLSLPADFRSPVAGKGADIDALLAAQSGTVVSVPTPSPTPSSTPTPTPQPSPVASPSPSPVPSPTVAPTPVPTPTPTPEPICAMTITTPVMSQWSSGVLRVNVVNSPAISYSISVKSDSGQLWVTPITPTGFVNVTSAIAEFNLQSKKKSTNVTVAGPCGSQSVMVVVR